MEPGLIWRAGAYRWRSGWRIVQSTCRGAQEYEDNFCHRQSVVVETFVAIGASFNNEGEDEKMKREKTEHLPLSVALDTCPRIAVTAVPEHMQSAPAAQCTSSRPGDGRPRRGSAQSRPKHPQFLPAARFILRIIASTPSLHCSSDSPTPAHRLRRQLPPHHLHCTIHPPLPTSPANCAPT